MQRVLATFLIALLWTNGALSQGYLRAAVRTELVASPRMHEVFTLARLPSEIDWRWKDGQDYTTVNRNQHIPKYCGACYAFGAVTALNDRIRIARGAAGREINLAVQVVLNCDHLNLGCNGGDPLQVYYFISESGGIPEETCQLYEAEGHDTGRTCEAKDVCRKCDAHGCSQQDEYEVYGIEEYGIVKGEFQMMAELQRGPLACAISTPHAFVHLTGYDIFEDPTHDDKIDHIINVVGYGTDNDQDYWVVRNSWGTYWGHYGWARVARGNNTLMIEEECVWATPRNNGTPVLRHALSQTSKARSAPQAVPVIASSAHGINTRLSASVHACRTGWNNWTAAGGERVNTPQPHTRLQSRDLPHVWDWSNVSGVSFVSWNTNEQLPHGSCASCWAHAITSALADRIAIQRKGRWPQVGFSPQMLINCHGGGSCAGGNPAGAYAYIHRHGITDETCQNYQGKELECNPSGVCVNCAPGGEHGLIWPGHCAAVEHPIVWYVSEYGSVRGSGAMKAEIYQRGPIGCGLESTSKFRQYTGGIYSEFRLSPLLNHQVSLSGWGVAGRQDALTQGTEFWTGRNSWGTYWGEGGWFRIRMHEDNLGVELDCDWGVPTPAALVPSTMVVLPEKVDGLSLADVSVISCLAAVVIAFSCIWFFEARHVLLRAKGEDSAPYIRIA